MACCPGTRVVQYRRNYILPRLEHVVRPQLAHCCSQFHRARRTHCSRSRRHCSGGCGASDYAERRKHGRKRSLICVFSIHFVGFLPAGDTWLRITPNLSGYRLRALCVGTSKQHLGSSSRMQQIRTGVDKYCSRKPSRTLQAAGFSAVSADNGQPRLLIVMDPLCARTSVMPPKVLRSRAAELTLSLTPPAGFGYLDASDFPVSLMNDSSCLPEHWPSATRRN